MPFCSRSGRSLPHSGTCPRPRYTRRRFSRVGLPHQIVPRVRHAAVSGAVPERTVDRPEFPVRERGFGQRVAVCVLLFPEDRRGILGLGRRFLASSAPPVLSVTKSLAESPVSTLFPSAGCCRNTPSRSYSCSRSIPAHTESPGTFPC